MARGPIGDVPDRFAVRIAGAGPGPVLTAQGFSYAQARVYGMVLDRATGHGAWTFAATPEEAHDTLAAWAETQLAAEPNPFEPRWKPPGDLTEARAQQQRDLRRLYRKEMRARDEVEAQRQIERLRDRGALFAVSHSGGKDSQAMAAKIEALVPAEQMLWIHAPLKGVEWAGIVEQVKRYKPPDVPLIFAEAIDQEGEEKWLLDWVIARGKWPSKGQRWCTSDFKRGPIRREIGRYADAHGYTIIVDAMGLRAQESSDRAGRPALSTLPEKHGVRSRALGVEREWYEWLPIKWDSTTEVFQTIEDAGEVPMWTYLEGMSRASCAFCILASKGDLRRAAELAPDLYAAYVAVEQHIGHTIQTRKPRKGESRAKLRRARKLRTSDQGIETVLVPLEDVTGLKADPKLVRKYLRQIERTGELRSIPVAGREAYAAAKRRGRRPEALRVLTQKPEFGQMEFG